MTISRLCLLYTSHKDEEGQHTTLKHQFEFAGRRVLIVEDNEINEEILKELLKLVGAETESARNGQEAVAMFQNSADGEYDFILMDIQMPILNGYEAVSYTHLDVYKRQA